ncbi:hypothetical protein JTB14_005289 [Gonioctena quinquepunctata]|nr:hypothetical protein JTB14_005289 [Gonioctena quinquepunctata]
MRSFNQEASLADGELRAANSYGLDHQPIPNNGDIPGQMPPNQAEQAPAAPEAAPAAAPRAEESRKELVGQLLSIH